MRIFEIIFFFPAIVCAYWTCKFLMSKKTPRQIILAGCTTVFVAYFTTYAFLTMPNTNYRFLCEVDIIGVPLALLALAMISIYINLFITKSPPTIPHMVLLIPGLMYTSALAILYYIIGIDDLMRLAVIADKGLPLPPEMKTRVFKAYIFVDQQMTMYITLFLFLLLTIECIWVDLKEKYQWGDLFRFLFFGKRLSPAVFISNSFIILMILLLPVSLNFHQEIQDRPFLGGSLALAIGTMSYFIGLAEYHSNIKEFTFRNMINSKQYYEKQLEDARVTEFARAEKIQEEAEDNDRSYKERRHKELILQLRKLMEIDRIYLDPDISIIQVADKLGVGRTVLSTLVNKNFGKNFRSLINEYRIEYSKNFMMNNITLTQEQVAFKCGFNDASAFSHKFKDIVGIAPLSWLTAEIAKNEKNKSEES